MEHFLIEKLGIHFVCLKPHYRKVENIMPGKKGHQLNMHLTEEEYGWLVRYAEKTD